MRVYLGMAVVALALLIAASGVAAITRGWVLPVNRETVRRPRLYGWAQLVVAAALCCQVVFGLMADDVVVRQWGTMAGSALLVAGVVLIALNQRAAGRGRGTGAP
ncbi:hypothetical protein AB0H29_19860 [Streptomyces thermolilacinus]